MAQRMSRLSFFKWVLSHPLSVLLITFSICIACALGLSGLSTSNDYRAFLDDEYPPIVELAEVEETFQENKMASLMIMPKGGSVFSKETLEVVRSLTEASWQVPKVTRVDSISNFQHTKAVEDDLIVDNLINDELILTRETIAEIERISLAEPAIRRFLISLDSQITIINLTFDFDSNELLSSQERADVANEILVLLEEARQQHPDIDFRASGTYFADYVADTYLVKINNVLMPLMLLVMLVTLTILLRSFGGVMAAVVIVIASGVMTMGFFGWFDLMLEAVAALGPIVIMTLAVADSIHIIIGAQNALGKGLSKQDAILESLQINFVPVLLTSVTTVLGVITYTFTDFPSLRKLGVIVALGVSVAFVLSITLLPVLMKYLPLRASRPDSNLNALLASLQVWVVKHFRLIVPISLIGALIVSAFVTRTTMDESFSKMFKPHTEIAETIRIIDTKMAGILRMDVAVFGESDPLTGRTSLSDPEFLRTLEDFTKWAMKQDNVSHVSSIIDTYKRLNRSMHGDDPDWYKIPDTAQLAAQYLLMYEMSLPYGLDLSNQMSMDKSATLVSVSASNAASANVVALRDNIKQWFKINAPELRVAPTGVVAVVSDASYNHMMPSMAKGGAIALLMVSLVLFLALGSWRLGLLGMAANLIPIAVGYGLWGMMGQTVGFIVVSVAGICLGMVVDFAVHFIDKFRLGLKQHGSAELAVQYAYERVAKPLIVTAAVLVSGFSMIAFTELNSMAGLGIMTPLIICLALAFDLVVLPALLIWIYGGDRGPS
jgi:predicted RND superfamily exporter protein